MEESIGNTMVIKLSRRCSSLNILSNISVLWKPYHLFHLIDIENDYCLANSKLKEDYTKLGKFKKEEVEMEATMVVVVREAEEEGKF
ncbi:hypothetical protein Gohar_024293 [Gossypium harknessii]|uniref:Uncharacterized protein n=1 Tax=Gossypium harknessii TaxID=34285 RepID=A0A7J9HGL8_9ROSI|nr:hypothetical protein [Gossypium harknessii]